MPPLADAPFLDLFADDFRADPAPVIAKLRAETPVVRTAIGCLVIARDQVHALLSDPRLESSLVQLVRMQGVGAGPIAELVASSLLALDGADHARVRRLVSHAFTPRAVEPHRPMMRTLVDELIDSFIADGQCEFMGAFADHYPVQVICHLLGVPRHDHVAFARWGDALTYVLSFELGLHLDEVTEALGHLQRYLDALIAERRTAARDDLVSTLIAASDGADRLSDLELRALIGGLLFAGYDTTRNQLGLAMSLFCEHPDQWKLLRDDPSLVPRAVEEVLRIAGTVSVTPRLAAQDIEVGGWSIPQGTLVALSLAAANRDPAGFTEPEVFDARVEREPQFTFGGGPHYCLGANLARAELQEAFAILARRLGEVRPAGEPEWRAFTGIFGPTRLPLEFEGESR
jgi:cytochrome P450